jgi:hypothetical protein
MTFTGTLIEDLMAAVERAEHRAQLDTTFVAEPTFADASSVQPWVISTRDNPDYDSNFIGVA